MNSKFLKLVLGASLGIAVSAPLYAADVARADAMRTEAWSDSQVRAAMDKCHSMPADAQAKCIVNIRPAGGGGSSRAVSVADSSSGNGSSANAVKSGTYTEEEYMTAVKQCEGMNGSDKEKERCMADIKDHFGRM